jgi:hypothetical protein
MKQITTTSGVASVLLFLVLAVSGRAQHLVPQPPEVNGPIPPGLVCTAEMLGRTGLVSDDGSALVLGAPTDRGGSRHSASKLVSADTGSRPAQSGDHSSALR